MRVLTIVGARPQFIKAAMLSKAWEGYPDCEEILLHTGQHYDFGMSDVFFSEMDIPLPKYYLGVGSGRHGAQTAMMLEKTENILLKEQPDWVVVFGDTNSTIAAALAAAKINIPVAHVEAGLRSFNKLMPEETNRIVTDHVSTVCFTPTEDASKQLFKEGFDEKTVFEVGDIMYDAVLHFGKQEFQSTKFKSLGIDGPFVLATIHRAENTDSSRRLSSIVGALEKVNKDCPVIWPIHPRTRKILAEIGISPNLKLVDPVGYLDMLFLEKMSSVVVTDSGGVQKEAFFQQTPCITIRTETEWTELINCGWNRLVDPMDLNAIHKQITNTLNSSLPQKIPPLYGDGKSAQKMTEILVNF